MTAIHAIYENGVFRPTAPVDLPDGTEVTVLTPGATAPGVGPAQAASGSGNRPAEDIFAEMRPYMVDVSHVDDSRDAIYTRMPGE